MENQAINNRTSPIDIVMNNPNKRTVAAMIEAERIANDSNVKGYSDVEELLADLKSE